jgi:hypothetical protein
MLALDRYKTASIQFGDQIDSAVGSPPARPVIPMPETTNASGPLGIIEQKQFGQLLEPCPRPSRAARIRDSSESAGLAKVHLNIGPAPDVTTNIRS